MNDFEEEIFSEEYNEFEKTETQDETVTSKNNNNTFSELENTNIEGHNEYSISKPQRVIIKAIIKND